MDGVPAGGGKGGKTSAGTCGSAAAAAAAAAGTVAVASAAAYTTIIMICISAIVAYGIEIRVSVGKGHAKHEGVITRGALSKVVKDWKPGRL